ncbi:hypothetical protein CF68_09885, partial [Cupriavidus sp. SK-4]|uniref:TorF family putative porin n=1 Tax=Cupriavidus sp. SK-4 TaxID=574750 RepID=UPI0004532CA9
MTDLRHTAAALLACSASSIFIFAAMPAMAQSQPDAEAPAAAPASPHTFTANVSLVSDYRYRGISQTNLRPAIQGGFDYTHESGFYVGNW